MRVAIDAMLLRPPHTGVQKYITGLIEAMASHIPSVDLSVFVGRGHGWTPPDSDRITVRNAVVRSSVRSLRICWEQLVLPFKLMQAGADLLHAPGYVMPVLAPVLARKPTVLTVHDVTAIDRPDLVSGMNALHYGLALPLSMRLARCVIVPTMAVADRIAAQSLSVRRIEVVPWGVDDRFTVPERSSKDAGALKRYGVKKPYVLHVGTIEPKKDIDSLVKAFFAVKMDTSLPHRLVLAGPDGSSSKAVRRLIDGMQMQRWVVFTGHVQDEDLPGLYRQADLVVCPSSDEGFGFPPLEALLSGTAVAVSRIPAFIETLGDSVPMFAPGALSAMREMMVEMLKDEKARKDVVESGRKRVSQYTWKRCAERTFEIYRQCLS